MKKGLLVFISLMFVFTTAIKAQSYEPLTLNGNQSIIIMDDNVTFNGLLVKGDSILSIMNSYVTLNDPNCEVSENGVLRITNSTVEWLYQGGVRVKNSARVVIENSTVYLDYVALNRTYYSHGFGLSEASSIDVKNSDVGYIKLDDWASCEVEGGTIGEFGSTSHGESGISDTSLGRLILTYENTWLRFNQTLGMTDWASGDIVEAGDNTYPLSLVDVALLSPPSLQLHSCNLEANNTGLDVVLIAGNSGTKLRGVNATLIYLVEDVWANIEGSALASLRFSNGDFNIFVRDSKVGALESARTFGLNLKVLGSDIGDLNLMRANPDAPNNVELVNTSLDSLHLTPSSPPVYLFDGVNITKTVVVESGKDVVSPVITGSLTFSPGFKLITDEQEGTSGVTRVYMVRVMENGVPAAGKEFSVRAGNNTIHEGVTEEDGSIVFPIKYGKTFSLIEDPEQGGPYILNKENFTVPVKLKIGNTETDVRFDTQSPLTLDILASNKPTNERGASAMTGPLVLTASIIIVALVKTRKRTPQVQMATQLATSN